MNCFGKFTKDNFIYIVTFQNLKMDDFFFMLPTLVEGGLIANDNETYVLNTLPKAIISEPVVVLMQNIIKNNVQLNFKTPKRIDFFMEFFAVTLSLDYIHADLMFYVNNLYKTWISGPSAFKDKSSINMYYKKIIKQLSLPFTLNKKVPSEPNSKFIILLSTILDTYQEFYYTRGPDMDKETWKMLLLVSFGIVDKVLFSEKLDSSQKNVASLKQKAVHNMMSILSTCGLSDESIWTMFFKYAKTWSKCPDFLIDWGNWVVTIYEILNNRIFNLSDDENFLRFGVYSQNNRIKTDDLIRIFHVIINAVDLDNISKSESLNVQFAKTCKYLKQISLEIASKMTTTVCGIRYPLLSFLRMFKNLIVCDSIKSGESVELKIETIIDILSEFDLRGLGTEADQLYAYLTDRCQNSVTFIKNAIMLYSRQTTLLSPMGDVITAAIETLEMPNVNVNEYIVPLFTSTSVMIGKFSSISFERLWNDSSKSSCIIHLLANSFLYRVDMITFMKTILDTRPQKEIRMWITVFLGACVRENFFDAREKAVPLLNEIAQSLTTPDADETETCIALQSWIEAIEWGVEPTKEVFALCSFAEEKFKEFSPTSTYIRRLVKYLIARAAIHEPNADLCRCLCSSSQCHESESAKVQYVTVGDSILLSFVSDDEKIKIFSRGPFGKAAFEVVEDAFGNMPTPKFSPLKEELLSKPPQPVYGTFGKFNDVVVPQKEIQAKPAEDYHTWMRRPVVKFNDKHVTTLAEFLAKSGLLTNYDQFNIKIQDKEAAKYAIEKFDELETQPVVFIPIIHVMSDDKTIEFSDDKYERTTEYLQEFLSNIAEPFEINNKAADFLRIPHLRTSVPVAPCGKCFVAFLAPEMAQDLQGARKIAAMFEKSQFRIIFNETDSELLVDLTNSPTFIVNRIDSMKYFVRTGLTNTCFNQCQLMYPGQFTQSLLLLLEYRLFELNDNVVLDVIERRRSLIRSLSLQSTTN